MTNVYNIGERRLYLRTGSIPSSTFTSPQSMLLPKTPFAAALALFTLVGCANIIPYAPPASVAAARIRIVLPDSGHFTRGQAFGLASGTCEGPKMNFGMLGGPFGINFADRTPIGMIADAKLDPKAYYERKIPAGGRYMLINHVYLSNKSCQVATSFIPEADADYQAAVSLDMQGCRVFLTKLSADGEGKPVAKSELTAHHEACSN